jgi:hypothetical protein
MFISEHIITGIMPFFVIAVCKFKLKIVIIMEGRIIEKNILFLFHLFLTEIKHSTLNQQ